MIKKFNLWIKNIFFVIRYFFQSKSQYIHSISFKDSHGNDFTFTIGDTFEVNEENKGKIEKIIVRNNQVTTYTESFIVKHTMFKEASFVLKYVDEKSVLKSTLHKLIASAKSKNIVSPILANKLIEELQSEGK